MNDLAHAFEDASDFYIHYNKINIGSRSNRSNLTQTFAQQKKLVVAQVKSDYMKYFNANLSNSSIQIMAAAMDLSQEEFLTVLNNDLTNKLQHELSIDKLEKLHTIVKNGDINKFLQDAVKNENVQALSEALKVIAQALNLLDKDKGGLGAILLQATNSAKSFPQVGINLSKLLESYKISNNYRLIRRQSLEAAVRQLQNLATVLREGSFKTSKSKLSAKGLSTLLLNGIISTQIAQGLAFSASGKAGYLLHKAIIQAVGTSQVKVSSDYETAITITGKTDVKASNVNLSLQGYDSGSSGGGILIDLGISSKFYTGQNFNSNLTKPKGTYGSGSGGTLGEAIHAIWGDTIDRYLAYNFFTHEMYKSEFNDLIATRQILRLFATAGSESDFAQFMLVNGRIVSVWDIVRYAISSDLSLSRSQGGDQGIILTIPNRSNIYAANQYNKIDQPKENNTIASWNRSRKVNAVINNARIYAELHLNKLIAAIGNIYS